MYETISAAQARHQPSNQVHCAWRKNPQPATDAAVAAVANAPRTRETSGRKANVLGTQRWAAMRLSTAKQAPDSHLQTETARIQALEK